MIYVISKSTFGSYNVRDIQCNANWDCCPYSDYALIPDNLVEGILATKGYCDITLNSVGNEVTAFTARSIPSVPEECCGTNTVLSVNGVKANTSGEVTLDADKVGAAPAGYGLGVTACRNITTWEGLDATVANGWYYLRANTGGTGAISGIQYGMVRVCTQDGYYAVQEFYPAESELKFERRMNATVWGEWKNVSPSAFAPAGYGLGVESPEELVNDLNEAVETGTYLYTSGAANAPTDSGEWVHTESYGQSDKHQTAFVSFTGGNIAERWMIGGVWQPWEWVNPPMFLGEEYRTTERYASFPVYTKLIQFGAFSGGEKAVSHGISGMTEVVSISGKAIISKNPIVFGDMSSYDMSVDMRDEVVFVLGDYSFDDAYIILKYLKL